MKLRSVIQALQRENYARQFKIPPDNLGDRNLRMPCLNPECSERASVNFAVVGEYRIGAYNCPHCELRGDALDLIIALVGEDLDPYEEMTNTEVAEQAHIWAETYAGAEPESRSPVSLSDNNDHDESESAYVPSWLR